MTNFPYLKIYKGESNYIGFGKKEPFLISSDNPAEITANEPGDVWFSVGGSIEEVADKLAANWQAEWQSTTNWEFDVTFTEGNAEQLINDIHADFAGDDYIVLDYPEWEPHMPMATHWARYKLRKPATLDNLGMVIKPQ